MPLPRSTLTVNVVIALAALAPAAAAANTACSHDALRRAPVIFSDLVATSTLPDGRREQRRRRRKAASPRAIRPWSTSSAARVRRTRSCSSPGSDAAYASMEASFETMTGSASVGSTLSATLAARHSRPRAAPTWAVAARRSASRRKSPPRVCTTCSGRGTSERRRRACRTSWARRAGRRAITSTWLIEGAPHLECLLNEKLSWGTMSYSDSFLYGGGRGGVVPNFLKFYVSATARARSREVGAECRLTDNGERRPLGRPIRDGHHGGCGSGNAQYMWYDVGAVAIAWAINKSGKTSAQFWQAKGSDGFWNAISPWDGH